MRAHFFIDFSLLVFTPDSNLFHVNSHGVVHSLLTVSEVNTNATILDDADPTTGKNKKKNRLNKRFAFFRRIKFSF